MARGELSYSKVRALTRVASPATEDNFLMIALHGTAHHVERLVRGFRRAMDAQELAREAQQHTERSVSYAYAEDGSLILSSGSAITTSDVDAAELQVALSVHCRKPRLRSCPCAIAPPSVPTR